MENCRVCLDKPKSPIQLSEENKKIFFQITGVELTETKKEIVCKKCFEVLLVALKFREDAIEADDWFRKQDLDEEVTLEESEEATLEESEEELKPELKIKIFIKEGSGTIEQNEISSDDVKKGTPKKYIPKEKEPYICYFCEEKLRRYHDLVAHMRVHKQERRLMCRCCEKVFTCKIKRANHERSYRRKIVRGCSLVCQHCGTIFNSEKGLAMHSRVHTGVMNFKCTLEGCTEAFREKRAYYSHFVTKHGIKRPCVCLDCGTSYSNHISLRTHRRMYHTEQEKLLSCPECPDKKFLTTKNLEDHMAFKHRGERRHACSICPKGYGSRKNLKRHIRDVHRELYLELHQKGKFRKIRKQPTKALK